MITAARNKTGLVILVGIAMLCFYAYYVHTEHGKVQCLDGKYIARGANGFQFDNTRQIKALKASSGENDANASFRDADYRIIGSRFDFPRFYGVSDSNWIIADQIRKRYGYKVILRDESMENDLKVKQILEKYATDYNLKMMQLVMAKKRELLIPPNP